MAPRESWTREYYEVVGMMTSSKATSTAPRIVRTADGSVVFVSLDGVRTESGELLYPLKVNASAENSRGGANLLDLFAKMIEGLPLASIQEAFAAARYAFADASEVEGSALAKIADTRVARNVVQIKSLFERGVDQGELYTSFGFVEPLSAIVHSLATRFPSRMRGSSEDFVRDAALMTVLLTPASEVPLGPEIHLSALALSMMPDRLVAHVLRPDVAELVAQTSLRSLPDAPPRICRRACVVEVADPKKEVLFGSTVSLGCYEHEGRFILFGMDYPRGLRVAVWEPSWSGGDLDEGVAVDLDHELTRVPDSLRGEHRAWAKNAARFLLVFGLLFDTKNAPVSISDESSRSASERGKSSKKRGAGSAGKPAVKRPAWVTRYVSLTTKARRTEAPSSGEATASNMASGRVAQENTIVSGYLRRLPCTEGETERRWIWVESYEARRWVAPVPMKVVVSP